MAARVREPSSQLAITLPQQSSDETTTQVNSLMATL